MYLLCKTLPSRHRYFDRRRVCSYKKRLKQTSDIPFGHSHYFVLHLEDLELKSSIMFPLLIVTAYLPVTPEST